MSNNIVIKADNIGKKYFIGSENNNKDSFRDAVISGIISPFRRSYRFFKGNVNSAAELNRSFWALKDISFHINSGEVVGIIGRNGAGKSTLLKILSRITEPTLGYAEISGRVGSLLEVGTGFHQELTGRENIFLNGSILGMKNRDIKSKFDEIVEFSGVETFIDTPVKHYSSGMYLRLAFSVAAHLDPEILLVDEVLAVGDANFQKKCLGKMEEVAEEGRTVLFVSHNLVAIENLCNRAILLEKGRLEDDGNTKSIINKYLESIDKISGIPLQNRKDRKGKGDIVLINVELLDENISIINNLSTGKKTILRLYFESVLDNTYKNSRVSLLIKKNERPFLLMSTDVVDTKELLLSRKGFIDFIINELPLTSGLYYIDTFIESNGEIQDWVESAAAINVVDGDFYGTGRSYPVGWNNTTVLVKYEWKLNDS